MSQMVLVLVSLRGRKGVPNERKCMMARKRRLGMVPMLIDSEMKRISPAVRSNFVIGRGDCK